MLFFLERGILFLQIGSLYAIREISINILEIPTGAVADILGRRKTMVVSFTAYIFSFVIFYFAPSYFWLILAMLLFSFGDAMRTGTHKAMIFDYLQINGWVDQKVIYYGHTRSWSMLGSALSSVLAALVVILTGNYEMVFLFSILPYLADLLLVLSYPATLDGPIISAEKINIRKRFAIFFKELTASFKNKSLWVTILNLASYQGYFKAIKDYLQPIILLALGASVLDMEKMQDKESAAIIGVLYFIIYIVSSFTSRHSGKLVTWLKSPEKVINTTLFSGVLIGLACGGLITTHSTAAAVLLFVLIFVVQNIRKPVGVSLVANKVKNEVLATGLSVQSQFDSLFAALFAILMGILADTFDIGMALIIMGIGLFFIAIVVRLIPKSEN